MDDNAGSKIRINVTAGRRDSTASVTALVLIAAGVLLFLDNLGFLPFVNVRAYWPLAISAFGVAQMQKSRCGSSIVWGLTMIAVGVLLTLGNLHVIHFTAASMWPLFLIAAGASMLVRRTGFRLPSGQFIAGSSNQGGFSGNQLHEYALFSAVNRRIDSANFEGAELTSIFGEIKIDLRNAGISAPNREATVTANVAFGAIKLRVPETWKVVIRGNAVFGAYEDKTVPPRPGPGVETPSLIITGGASFGAVEIVN
jgi:hypothetical protein